MIVYLSCCGLGDLIMSSPAVWELTQHHEVVWIGEKLIEELGLPGKVRVGYPIEAANFLGDFQAASHIILGVPSLNSRWKDFIPKEFHSKIVSYDPSEEWVLRQYHHTVEMNLQLVRKISISEAQASYYMLDYEPSKSCSNICMHVGAQNAFWRNKAFPLEFYKEIADYLTHLGHDVYIVGDEGKSIYAEILRQGNDKIFNKTGLAIKETIKVMQKCLYYVGDDCGPAHLAKALDLDTYVFFGPTYYARTAPWPVNGKKSFQSMVSCGPCHLDGSRGVSSRFLTCNEPICHKSFTLEDFKRVFQNS